MSETLSHRIPYPLFPHGERGYSGIGSEPNGWLTRRVSQVDKREVSRDVYQCLSHRGVPNRAKDSKHARGRIALQYGAGM
jgi:hypothetical protein